MTRDDVLSLLDLPWTATPDEVERALIAARGDFRTRAGSIEANAEKRIG